MCKIFLALGIINHIVVAIPEYKFNIVRMLMTGTLAIAVFTFAYVLIMVGRTGSNVTGMLEKSKLVEKEINEIEAQYVERQWKENKISEEDKERFFEVNPHLNKYR